MLVQGGSKKYTQFGSHFHTLAEIICKSFCSMLKRVLLEMDILSKTKQKTKTRNKTKQENNNNSNKQKHVRDMSLIFISYEIDYKNISLSM